MYSESYFFKKELFSIAKKLEKKTFKGTLRDEFYLEKCIYLAFYIIRKLIENHKISTATMRKKTQVKMYSTMDGCVTRLNRYSIERHYDFNSSKHIKKDLRFLCNQIIHCYIFYPVYENENILGILFCSDYLRNTAIYEVSLSKIIDIIYYVSMDYPDCVSDSRNAF